MRLKKRKPKYRIVENELGTFNIQEFTSMVGNSGYETILKGFFNVFEAKQYLVFHLEEKERENKLNSIHKIIEEFDL
jgi:hypothetical protein